MQVHILRLWVMSWENSGSPFILNLSSILSLFWICQIPVYKIPNFHFGDTLWIFFKDINRLINFMSNLLFSQGLDYWSCKHHYYENQRCVKIYFRFFQIYFKNSLKLISYLSNSLLYKSKFSTAVVVFI